MAKTSDTSLLFSLRELEEIERDRTSREARAREQARQARESARREAERAAQETEARRIEALAARQREEDRRRRDEAAHRSALERAEVERVRAEVEARARKELAEASHAHEVVLASARALAAHRRYRWLLGATAAALVAIGGFASLLSVRLRALQGDAADRAAAVARELERCARATTDLDGARRRLRDLENELLILQRAALPAAPAVVPPVPARKPPKVRPGTPPKPCKADEWDPVGCLPSR